MSNKETEIHNAILLALTKKYHPLGFFWRQNAGKVQTIHGSRVSLGPPGIADIVGLVNGRIIFVEVKTKEGKQKKSQIAFQKAVNRAGGIYIVARSPEEALEALSNFNLS